MGLKRRWVIQCDTPGCTGLLVFDNIPYGEFADYGQAAVEAGWDSAPNKKEAHCPDCWDGDWEAGGHRG